LKNSIGINRAGGGVRRDSFIAMSDETIKDDMLIELIFRIDDSG
jgi:hypothetical protein